MAEFVQLKLEESISSLEALKHAKLFDESEIKAIITQKREHEYRLRRRKKLYKDYLSYINYEMSLLDLARLRYLKFKTHHLEFNSIEHAINCNIERIFRDALKVFSNELVVWNDYISFLKKSIKQLLSAKLPLHQSSDITAAKAGVSALYTDYLACHGANHNTIPVWIEAAYWEWSEVDAEIEPIERVRALLKRGLRYHGTNFELYSANENEKSADILWLVYFKIELEYRARIIQRSSIIKFHPGNEVQNKLKIHITDEPTTEHLDCNTLKVTNLKDVKGNDPIMTGQMAMIVFKYALKAFFKKWQVNNNLNNCEIASLSNFIIKFFEIADNPTFLDGPNHSLIDQMLDHLKVSAINNEVLWTVQFWMAWKKILPRSSQPNECLDSCLKLMLDAIHKTPTQSMIMCIVDFLNRQSITLKTLDCDNNFHELLLECSSILDSNLKCDSIVWEKFLQLVNHFLLDLTNLNLCDSLGNAYEYLLNEAVIRHPQVLLFWELLIQTATIKDNCDQVLKVLRDFQLNKCQTDSKRICITVSNWFEKKSAIINPDDVHKMIDLAEIILNTISLQPLIEQIKVHYLKFVFDLQGKSAGMTLYQKLKQRPVSFEFFEKAISLYKSAALANDAGGVKSYFSSRKKNKKALVKLSCASSDLDQIELMYQDALEMYGSELPQLWIDYIKFKSCHYADDAQKMLSSHSHIYQKALKVLQPNMLPLFIKSYALNSLDFYL